MMDLNDLLKEIKQTNLCTWYLLPLTGLTRFSFGEGLFINSYLDVGNSWIIVHVPDLNLVSSRLQIQAVRTWSNDRGGFLAYQLSPVWNEVIHCYVSGRYSQFPDDVKTVIFERSGLPYRQPDGKKGFITDVRLMALEGHEELKRYLREQLDVHELPEELLLPPSPDSFMDVQEMQ